MHTHICTHILECSTHITNGVGSDQHTVVGLADEQVDGEVRVLERRFDVMGSSVTVVLERTRYLFSPLGHLRYGGLVVGVVLDEVQVVLVGEYGGYAVGYARVGVTQRFRISSYGTPLF